jgi:hypothetical protein
MGATVQADEELFGVRPLFAWQRTMGLVPSPVERRIAQRALNVAIISWLPLFVFAAATELIFRNGTARSFLPDGAVHTRFLIALLAVPGCHGTFRRSRIQPRDHGARPVHSSCDDGGAAHTDFSRSDEPASIKDVMHKTVHGAIRRTYTIHSIQLPASSDPKYLSDSKTVLLVTQSCFFHLLPASVGSWNQCRFR